jgi:hypothetical protein
MSALTERIAEVLKHCVAVIAKNPGRTALEATAPNAMAGASPARRVRSWTASPLYPRRTHEHVQTLRIDADPATAGDCRFSASRVREGGARRRRD